jgi:membrane protein implicated in regulation of membrane protease activity
MRYWVRHFIHNFSWLGRGLLGVYAITSFIAAVAVCVFAALAPNATLGRVWVCVGLAANAAVAIHLAKVVGGRWRRSAPVAPTGGSVIFENGAVQEMVPEYRGRARCGCHTWRAILSIDPSNQPVHVVEPERTPGNNFRVVGVMRIIEPKYEKRSDNVR